MQAAPCSLQKENARNLLQIRRDYAIFQRIQIFFTSNLAICTMQEGAQMFCQFGFRIAKRLQQDYLLPLFQPLFSMSTSTTRQHQQIQDLLTSI
jgi:hypothetical protein